MSSRSRVTHTVWDPVILAYGSILHANLRPLIACEQIQAGYYVSITIGIFLGKILRVFEEDLRLKKVTAVRLIKNAS